MGRGVGGAAGAAPLLASIVLVQVGAAASTSLFAQLGAFGTAWLRLSWAAAIMLVIARPRAIPRRDVASAAVLGLVSAAMTMAFFEAISRIPLATAVALEFLGPLGVALVRRTSRRDLLWPVLALAGLALVTQVWRGGGDLVGIGCGLGAGAGYATYIVLTQHVGDRISGYRGLAISMTAAALSAAVVGAPQAIPYLTLRSVVESAGLALLFPVLPYALELHALRRLTAAAFGTLMSLEPVVALIAGVLLLGQWPQPAQGLGVGFITVAAVGAARRGGRDNLGAPRSTGPAHLQTRPGHRPRHLSRPRPGQHRRRRDLLRRGVNALT